MKTSTLRLNYIGIIVGCIIILSCLLVNSVAATNQGSFHLIATAGGVTGAILSLIFLRFTRSTRQSQAPNTQHKTKGEDSHLLEFTIPQQPNNTTCGPTCLCAIYQYYLDEVSLEQIINEVDQLDTGGTYAVLLGAHALERGYQADVFTYNLQVFDPTWFALSKPEMLERLRTRRIAKAHEKKLAGVIDAYIKFLELGGCVHFQDLSGQLILSLIKKGNPIVAGLSSTYLYRAPRELSSTMDDNDIEGDPQGHFVVLCGYDHAQNSVLVADPLHPKSYFNGSRYSVDINRLICSILLGSLTYDANLLIITPPPK